MRICLYSNFFLPQIGGTEIASRTLAEGWAAMGHVVTVVTNTPAGAFDDGCFPFPVVRDPTREQWRSLLSGSDLLVSNGCSVRHLRAWRAGDTPFGWIHGMILGDPRAPRDWPRLFLNR